MSPRRVLRWNAVQAIDGEMTRFRVRSRTHAGWYLVDLDRFDFNGQCNCIHFETRLGPRLREGERHPDNLRCWHIRMAREFFCDLHIKIAMKYADETKTNQKRVREAVCQAA